MTDQPDQLFEFSKALAARVAAAKDGVAAISVGGGRHLTGTLWQSDLLVASEQSLPKRTEFEVLAERGSPVTATLVGRDPGTNIAVLKSAKPLAARPIVSAEPQVGALVLAIGADSQGSVRARLGLVNAVGPQWHSRAGGRIDHHIALDIRIGSSEEGGPVIDAMGRYLGISTFGPRAKILVIPATTIDRIVPALVANGRIKRGWLGVTLQRVAIPDGLAQTAEQSTGVMVMSIAENGPAAAAGLLPSDIILSVDGKSTARLRNITSRFGTDSIGQKAELRLIRGGEVISLQLTISERPPA